MSRRALTLLSRPHCGLCEEYELALLEEAADTVQLDVVDVDQHPAWRAEYGLRIPVLLDSDGRWLGEGLFSPEALTG